MSFRRVTAALFLATAVGAVSAQAQTIDDPEAAILPELIVNAKLPGPAWWRVSDGDTTIYVLGVPDALPKGLAWDQTALRRRLKGANALITGPEIRAGANPLALPGLIVSIRRTVRAEDGFSEAVPDALERRFEAAAAKARFKTAAAEDLRPWFAGMRLAESHRKTSGLDFAQPETAIRKAAKSAKVKARPAYVVKTKVKSLIGELRGVSPEAELECLDGAVAEVEAGPEAFRAAARAWADGKVAAALTEPRGVARCIVIVPTGGRLRREHLAKQADALAEALQQPGHAVAVLSLRSLVAKDGILDRLRDRGFSIRTPE